MKTECIERGPYTRTQVQTMWQTGFVTCDAFVREQSSSQWVPIEDFTLTHAARGPETVPSTHQSAGATRTAWGNADTSTRLLVVFAVFAMAVMFFGYVHIISGDSLSEPIIVRKKSFGLSETFVNIDQISGMPWNAARARFPLGCAILKDHNLVKSLESNSAPMN